MNETFFDYYALYDELALTVSIPCQWPQVDTWDTIHMPHLNLSTSSSALSMTSMTVQPKAERAPSAMTSIKDKSRAIAHH